MKKIFFLLLIFIIHTSFASSWELAISETCEYKWEFEQCKSANKTSQTRSIEDFVCLPSQNDVEIMWQIVLDKEFKKLDKELDTYLKNLEDNKSYYFWKDSKEPFTSWVDDIEKKFDVYWEFWEKYMNLCKAWEKTSILSKTIDCFSWWIPNMDWKNYFFQDTICKSMVLTKLSVHKQVAYDVLKLNKQQVKKDEDKLYMQEERTKYDKLLEIVMVNVWFLERIWKKWPSKTKSAK